MSQLTWTECVLIGATAGVDPTVARRMSKGLGVRRSSRKVVMEAAEKLGLSSRFPDGGTEGQAPVENVAA